MIFIGLDVSKISTALCIENNGITKLYNYTTKKSNNCWIEDTKEFINYRNFEYKYINEKEYSKKELYKLVEFNEITDLIINDIFDNIKYLEPVKIGIEGYSYSSNAGPIFDLIEFTTILKHKLLHKLNGYSNIQIISPLTLKTEVCKMIYKPRIEVKGKKVIKHIIHLENDKGKQATKFDKKDMFQAFIDSKLDIELKKWCEEYQKEILKNKDLPKPIDDVIDAIWLAQIVKRQ
jgi:hypothetical protein